MDGFVEKFITLTLIQFKAVFASDEEAQRAMSKHKQNMQNRYIELYYGGAM